MPSATRITSRQHDLVRRFRQAARRTSDDAVLLDGEHLLADALDAGVPIEVVLTDGRGAAVAARARKAGAAVHDASATVLEAASPVRTPSGVVAIARWQPAAIEAVLQDTSGLVIGVCGVQDPGNVGSVIRAADALGASGVLVLDDSAHPAGWKALRGSMGSAFRVPIAVGGAEDAIGSARRRGLRIVATVADAGEAVETIDLSRPSLVLLGREGSGLADDVVARADARVTIPMRPRANSLNVAAAAAVILYEARRQRAGTK